MMCISILICMLLWIGYIGGGIVLAWACLPMWGGWATLDSRGKAFAMVGILVGLACGLVLCTSIVSV